MTKTKPPYPAAFKQQPVELARACWALGLLLASAATVTKSRASPAFAQAALGGAKAFRRTTVIVEEAVFSAARAGDPLALDQLLRQLQPDIRRYARLQCHRGSAVDDVVQEAMIILYRRMGSVRNTTALAGWIFRVVARLCMLPALALLRGTVELTQIDNSPHFAEIPQHELRLDLVRALESLPRLYRQVILLRDMEQLTITEIADCLQITREATKSRIHRARALVREYMLAGHRSEHNEAP